MSPANDSNSPRLQAALDGVAGMSDAIELRDLFALVEFAAQRFHHRDGSYRDAAEDAYRIADFAMRARNGETDAEEE